MYQHFSAMAICRNLSLSGFASTASDSMLLGWIVNPKKQ